MNESPYPWPHAPRHEIGLGGVFLVTASTYGKAHFFRGGERLSVLQRGLLALAHDYGWRLEAWAIFSNHYHFIAHSPETENDAGSLRPLIRTLHVKTAGWVNTMDREPARQVWFNYWDTRLTYPASYLARLNYVHQNAVKHGLILVANQYPWCSARWFERTASPAQVQTIYRFKTDALAVSDDYDPAPEV